MTPLPIAVAVLIRALNDKYLRGDAMPMRVNRSFKEKNSRDKGTDVEVSP